jgi:ribosome maturation factor RimP
VTERTRPSRPERIRPEDEDDPPADEDSSPEGEDAAGDQPELPPKPSRRARPKPVKPPRPEVEGASPRLKAALDSLEPRLGPLAAELNLEVVSLKLGTTGGRPAVKLVIDKLVPDPSGRLGSQVTIEDCAAMSRLVSRNLDELYPGQGPRYSLEVSSPGLDRALVTEADFRRFHGALARVGLRVEGRVTRLRGRLSTASKPWRLTGDDGETTFDLTMVKSARLVPEI